MCKSYLVFKGWIIFHCVYTTLCLSIHLLNACVASTFWLLWIMLLWIWDTNIQFLVLNILGVFPGPELMDSVLTLFVFEEPPTVFCSCGSILLYPFIWQSIYILWMDLPYFAYSLTCWWAFSVFLPWAVENSAAMNIGVQLYIWTTVLNSLYVCLGVELLKHMIITFLYFWENAEVLHTLIALFYISKNKVGVPIYVHFCQHFLFVFIVDFSHVNPVCLIKEGGSHNAGSTLEERGVSFTYLMDSWVSVSII